MKRWIRRMLGCRCCCHCGSVNVVVMQPESSANQVNAEALAAIEKFVRENKDYVRKTFLYA